MVNQTLTAVFAEEEEKRACGDAVALRLVQALGVALFWRTGHPGGSPLLNPATGTGTQIQRGETGHSMALTFTRHPDAKRYELRPRGAAPVHVRRGAPDGRPLPKGCKPRFTLADDRVLVEQRSVLRRSDSQTSSPGPSPLPPPRVRSDRHTTARSQMVCALWNLACGGQAGLWMCADADEGEGSSRGRYDGGGTREQEGRLHPGPVHRPAPLRAR